VLTEDLVKRYPNENRALSALVSAQIVNKKNQHAEETLAQIIEKNKNDIDHRLLLARLLYENSAKEKESLKLLDETIAIAPENPQAYVLKTAYLIKSKNYSAALTLAEQVEKKFPNISAGKLLKADTYLAQQNLDEALDNYRQAYKIQPNNRVLIMMADILNLQKNSAEAIELLGQELAKNPKNNAIHFKLAGIYQQQKDYKQAEKHYKDILKDQPGNALVLNNLAWIYVQEKNPEAIELAGKAYQKAPQSAAIVDTFGYILVKQGHPKQGLDILKKAAELAPNSKDILFHLAEAYAENGQVVKAQEVLKKILADDKNFEEKSSATELLEKLSKK
jgi:putative PEP-CTERM system TPR-repeat lipoprotein